MKMMSKKVWLPKKLSNSCKVPSVQKYPYKYEVCAF